MPVNKLKTFLDENDVKYVTIKHSNAFTAQEIASSIHVSGKEFAKTVMLTIGKEMVMAVLPASYKVDFEKLQEIVGKEKVELASEAEFKYHFPDCEVGAMPPFGNLYDMETFVAEVLAENEEIAFNAGSHSEVFKMKYDDFARLVEPKIFKFSWKSVATPNDPQERWSEDL